MSYIKLDRKLMTWGWKDVPEMVALWIDILIQANCFPNEWHGEIYEEGTFPTSVEKLSISTGLSVRTVRTCLERLKKSGEIEVETTNRGTKIKVVKWGEYQGCDDAGDEPIDKPSDKQATNSRQTTDNQPTTLKESKESKEYTKKENTKERKFVRPSIEDVRSYCQERNNGVDPDRWYSYYESNGWRVGRNPMKDWRACVRTWERHSQVRPTNVANEVDTLPTYSTANNKTMSIEDEDELMRLMGRA